MTQLIILVAAAVAVIIAVRYREYAREQRLRDNPPQRRLIEVRLPRGINDANVRMQRFYRKVASAAMDEGGKRQVGERQIDIVYLAEVPAGGHAEPQIRFLIYADPDKMDAVKRSLKQAFDDMADVTEPKHDPLWEIAEQLRPPKEQAEEDTGQQLDPQQAAVLAALQQQAADGGVDQEALAAAAVAELQAQQHQDTAGGDR